MLNSTSLGNMVVPTVTQVGLKAQMKKVSGYPHLTPFTQQEDLTAFHTLLFGPYSRTPATTFEAQPVTEDHEAYDDGLGYYEDGVKRTLTDEQIAMFRHSEIQALLRDRRHKVENKDASVEVEKDVGRSAPALTEEVDGLAAEDEEEEYARFLEEERRQMERDAAANKRKRSTEDAGAIRGREATHRRTARELDVNLETNDTLDYDEKPSRPTDPGEQERTQERTQDLYERRRVDYVDNDTGENDNTEVEASSHVNGVSDGGRKIWWPMIGS